jgi:hypothetical protein
MDFPSLFEAAIVMFRRYHPTPLDGKRHIPPPILGALNGPFIAQSWGRVTVSQVLSSNEDCTYVILLPGAVPEGRECFVPALMKSLPEGSRYGFSAV